MKIKIIGQITNKGNNNKTIYIVIGLILISIIIISYIYVMNKSSSSIHRRGDILVEEIDEKLFVADSAKIDKIEIVRTDVSITLEKVNGKWMITKPLNYQADINAVTPILGNLAHFKIESIISEKSENFGNYLDSALHPVVTCYEVGKLLGTFEVGKYAINYSNAYIKLPNENRILLASNLASNNFTKPLNFFQSKLTPEKKE